MTNIVATGGRKCRPHLAQILNAKFEAPNNDQCINVQISNQTLEIIKKGMVGACSPGGTAFPFFDWNEGAIVNSGSSNFAKATGDSLLPLVACKTGTAEYMSQEGKMKTHGWLTAYAPVESPQISVTVVVEGGGEGSNVAAPIVRQIMAKYFQVSDSYPYGKIVQLSE
jgi:penicillin-binding protein 2